MVFVLHGAVVASWLVRIPDAQSRLGVGEATLGLVLAGLAAGVLLAMPLAGGAVPRVGSRRVTAAGALVSVLALPLTGLAPSPVTLAACLVVLGAGTAVMDVGMNAQGIGIEAGYGRSVLVGLHAAWSLGALTAAGLGAAALSVGVDPRWHLGATAAVVAAGTLTALPWLRIPDRQASGDHHPRLALPRGALAPIAVVALGATTVEATGGDWSGIALRDLGGVPPERAAWGFVAFIATMTAGRLVGDRVADRLGPAATVRGGGWLAGGGLALAAAVGHPVAVLVGFAAAGLGVAAVTPLAFAAAGRRARSAGAGMAAVASVGYLGLLLAPPLVGTVAEVVDLRASLLLVAGLVVALTARPRGFAAGDRA